MDDINSLPIVYLYKTELFEAFGEVVSFLAADLDTGKILFASKPLEDLFGYRIRNELVGMSVDNLVPSSLRDKHKKHRKTYSEDAYPRAMGKGLILSGQHKDGHTFPIEIALYPTVIRGQRIVLALILNMSERSPAPTPA